MTPPARPLNGSNAFLSNMRTLGLQPCPTRAVRRRRSPANPPVLQKVKRRNKGSKYGLRKKGTLGCCRCYVSRRHSRDGHQLEKVLCMVLLGAPKCSVVVTFDENLHGGGELDGDTFLHIGVSLSLFV